MINKNLLKYSLIENLKNHFNKFFILIMINNSLLEKKNIKKKHIIIKLLLINLLINQLNQKKNVILNHILAIFFLKKLKQSNKLKKIKLN
jgi:hypothetical protein